MEFLISDQQTSVLCKEDASKTPALQSDSVLNGLTDDNIVAVVIQNTLETNRYT